MLLRLLPQATETEHEEVLHFVQHRLMGKGHGYIDGHLSASALLTGVTLWALAKRLNEAQGGLGNRYNNRKE